MFVQKLASVEKSSLVRGSDYRVNAFRLIIKYLVGLRVFELNSNRNERLNNRKVSALCNEILDLVLSAKERASVILRALRYGVLENILLYL